jgi:hypothetical protein
VTRNDRKVRRRGAALDLVEFRVAHPAGRHGDEDLFRTRDGIGHLDRAQRPWLVCDRDDPVEQHGLHDDHLRRG